MPTRNVVLTDHQEELVARLVATGHYQNASEVLREGLRLVQRRDAEDRARLQALRAAAREGINDAKTGRYSSFNSADSLRAHLLDVGTRAIAQERLASRQP